MERGSADVGLLLRDHWQLDAEGWVSQPYLKHPLRFGEADHGDSRWTWSGMSLDVAQERDNGELVLVCFRDHSRHRRWLAFDSSYHRLTLVAAC